MTNSQKTTKKAVLAGFLSLLLCVSMLIGSTWAWFTDSAVSSGNKIQAGTLKLKLEMKNKTNGDWQDITTSSDPVFNYDMWEPGYTEAAALKITNDGSLALKYAAKFVGTAALTKLADVIDVYTSETETLPSARTDLETWTKQGTLSEFFNTADTVVTGTLTASQSKYLAIAFKMQESAGNEYQGLSLGGAFDIQVLATQWTDEADSFGKDYDAAADETPDNANWPYEAVGTKVVTDPANDLDVTASNVTVTVPKAALSEGDKFELVIDDTSSAIDGNTTTLNFDLKLKKNGALVGETDGIEYTVKMQLDTELEIGSLTHNGEAVTGYTYDSATGVLTFKVSHFSPFVLVYNKAAQVVEPANTEELKEALDNYNESEEVRPMEIKLSKSFAYEETPLTVENGKDVTIDLNGNDLTINNNESDGLVVEGGGTLTLTNSKENGVYKFNTESRTNDGIYVLNETEGETTTLNFEDVNIDIDASQWISIHACAPQGQSVININEGTVINVTGDNDQIAGIYADGGSVINMNGGTINVNVVGSSRNDAVGVLVGNGMNTVSPEGATFNMNGGTINVIGGGTFACGIQTASIYNNGNNNVFMNGGTINVTGKDACAIAVAGSSALSNVDVSGGTINVNVDSGYTGLGFTFESPNASCGAVQVKKGVVNLHGDNNKLTDVPARVNEYD